MYINFLSSYSHPLICIEQAQWFKSSDPMAVMKLYTCMSQIRLQSFLQGCRMRFSQVDCQYRKECYETGKHYNSDVELNSNVCVYPSSSYSTLKWASPKQVCPEISWGQQVCEEQKYVCTIAVSFCHCWINQRLSEISWSSQDWLRKYNMSLLHKREMEAKLSQ